MSAAVDPVGKSDFLSSDRMIGLSDTIFGVAMTLQASTLLLSIPTLKGSVADIIGGMRGQSIAVALSFVISGSYWIVQQRRLAMIKSVTPLQTLLHFLVCLIAFFHWHMGPVWRNPSGRDDLWQPFAADRTGQSAAVD